MGQRLTCDIRCWQQQALGGPTCFDKATLTEPQEEATQ